MVARKMHQTTVRFGPDLWAELAEEAERSGVSVAQFIRDAALMRVSYMRGRRGDPYYDAAVDDAAALDGEVPPSARSAERARQRAGETGEATRALGSQNRQARLRAERLREQARAQRRDRE
jgi:hypothetical protein